MQPTGEMWANLGQPVNPDKDSVGSQGRRHTFSDHGMRWINSGKNDLYASIQWSNRS
jgi:hypothetical protein